MKTLKISLSVLGIIALLTCNDSDKKAAKDNPHSLEFPDNTTVGKTDSKSDTTTINQNSTQENQPIKNDNQTKSSGSVEMKAMYDYLQMSQDQIARFEKEYKQKVSDMRDVKIDQENMLKQKEESLKIVLSEAQYSKYEQWKIDHPKL